MPDDPDHVSTNPDWGHPGHPRAVSCEAVQGDLEGIEEPATASEVAEVMDEAYKPVRRRFEELHEDRIVDRKTVGGYITIWW